MNRLVVLAGLTALLLGSAACGGPTPGRPSPVTTAGGATTGNESSADTSAPTSRSSALPVAQPCALLSSGDLTQIGASSPPSQDMVGTAHSCEIDTADDHIGLDIRTNAGLGPDTFAGVAGGGPVTSPTVGSHQAKEQDDPSASSCTVAIGVSASSRVDVTATGDGTKDPCPVALAVARLVEPKLP